jgi:hypothetical protein
MTFIFFVSVPHLRLLRQTVAHDCKNAINTIINAGNDTVSLRLINFCLFPQYKEDFKQGNVHTELEKKIRDKVGDRADKLARQVGYEVSAAYHKVWGKYTDTLAERKLNLDGRLRQVYNTTTRKIKKAVTFDNG